MKKILIMLAAVLISTAAMSQTDDKVYDVVEEMPSYPGGMSALMQYLSSNIKYPVEAEKNGIQGRVICTFVIEKDGSITDVKVAKSVHPLLDKEAMRVVSSMPKWIPGKQNGASVRAKFTLPITFRLSVSPNTAADSIMGRLLGGLAKPASKIVASGINIDGIYYELTETEARVISGKKKYIGDVIIPSIVTYEGVTYSVMSIEEKAFDSCNRLTSVTIPGSVKKIGYNAFHYCTALRKICCYAEQVPTASGFAFDKADNVALYVPEASMGAYRATMPWSKFKYIMKLSKNR